MKVNHKNIKAWAKVLSQVRVHRIQKQQTESPNAMYERLRAELEAGKRDDKDPSGIIYRLQLKDDKKGHRGMHL